MKYNEISKKDFKGKYKFIIEKYLYYLSCFKYEKKERNRRIEYYKEFYHDDIWQKKKNPQNKIPDNAYFEPLGFVVSDLLPANELNIIKNNLDKLILKQKCNKYLGGCIDLEGIEKIRTYEPGASFWVNIGRIDFDNKKNISTYIKDIHLRLMNLNESYLMLVLTVSLTDEQLKKMNMLMSENYNDAFGGYSSYYFENKKNKTGSKHKTTKYYVDVNSKKLRKREVEIIRIKKMVFDELEKYFPLQLHLRKIIQPSFTFYKTNLNEINNISKHFYSSIGFDSVINGKLVDFNIKNDMMMYSIGEVKNSNNYVIAFDKKIDLEEGFYSKDSQLVFQLEQFYLIIARTQMANYLYSEFRDICILYRNVLGSINIVGRNLERLYKLRNKFYIDINFFRNATKVDKIEKDEIEFANKILMHSIGERIGSGDYFSNFTIKTINDFSKIVDKEIDDKINICRDLAEKFNISFNKIMTFLSLAIALISLIVAIKAMGK